MEFILKFNKLNKKNADIAGGKGASLGEMTQASIPVPEGYVILSDAFERFILETHLTAEIDSILHKVNHEEIHTVDHASEEIKALILSKDMPKDLEKDIMTSFKELNTKYVAVRSSATAEDSSTAAWAGQLESYLNTTQDALLEKVKHCWASLFTPRAIVYRFEKNLHKTKISVAVVIQKMVESEISGIAFSVHPVTQDYNQLIIEAGLGLGEAIVSGQITPDSYILEKDRNEIIEKNISEQTRKMVKAKSGKGNEWINIPVQEGSRQKLSEQKIKELSNLIIKIEDHYGFPVDIEWAYEKGHFYIVQSRPITTLTPKEDDGLKVDPLKKRAQVKISKFKKENYILSFWVQGVSVFVTDIHLDSYKELEVLYVIDQGMFKQYFTRSAYEKALDRGLKFYSNKQSFNEYKIQLLEHCKNFKKFFESTIQDKKRLDKGAVFTFFEYVKKLCGDYAKMNFEFTDKAFQNQYNNPIIKKNLEGVAKFKDQIRAIMNTVLFEPQGYTTTVFTILEAQFNLDSSIFNNLTQQEILNLFEGERPEKSVSERQKAFVEHNDTSRFYDKEEAQAIIDEFREEIHMQDILQGQIANPGIVTGKVKIIPVDYGNLKRINDEIEKMQVGDILVAETTAPELIAACKKARAIITDIGGLMSHAAIVSRELKIPCIVGTKFATQILKDGMEIEVDADKGIVKILETKKRKIKLKELFHQDVSLSLVELHYEQEAAPKPPWAKKKFDINPYIVYERKNGETYFYYDPKGIEWQMNQAGLFKEEEKAIKLIKEGYDKIKDIIEKEKILSRKELLNFIKDLRSLWPWLNYMWWGIEYREKHKQDFDNLIKIRKYTEYITTGMIRILKNSARRLYPKLGDYADFLLLREIENKKIPEIAALKERSKSYVYTSYKLYKSLEEIKEFKFEFEEVSKTDNLNGQVAFPGKVIGKIRIIRNREEIKYFQKGEILVAGTTTPDFLPAMKKARAIISEHGGAISHAAITSRELKIPCIIGVRDATKVFNTGDLVEVDADKGIVRIIK